MPFMYNNPLFAVSLPNSSIVQYSTLDSSETEEEIATIFASFFTKLIFERIERIASAIRDFDDSVTTTCEYFIFFL